MKLAQLKFIAITVLASGLSAVSLIAVSDAAGQGANDVGSANAVAQVADEPREKTAVVPAGESVAQRSHLEERLSGLEKQFEEFLRRTNNSQAAGRDGSAAAPESQARKPAISPPAVDARRPADAQHRSIQELETQLKLAIEETQNREILFRRAAISRQDWERSRGEMALVIAMLEGLDDDLTEEIDRLGQEIETKRAEAEKARAQTEVAMSVVKRNSRLNERKPGIVAAEDVAKAEWEMKSASAEAAIVTAKIAEINLRVQQLERRRSRVREILKTTKDAKPSDPNRADKPR